jgi:transcriptional regulator with XRE-family HTH domain
MTSTVMTKKSTQASRLKHLREAANLSNREVAAYIGRSSSQVTRYESVATVDIRDVVDKLAKLYKVTTDFILYGEDGPPEEVLEMRRQVSQAIEQSNIGTEPTLSFTPSGNNARRIKLDDINVRDVPVLPIRARATFAESYADDSYKYEPEEMLAVVGIPDTKEFSDPLIVEIDGDSMDPTLKYGALYLATPVPRDDWQYMASDVYCFVYRSSFVVKRVKDNTLLKEGLLTLHSDNPNGGTITIRGQDIRAVWRVRWGVYVPI